MKPPQGGARGGEAPVTLLGAWAFGSVEIRRLFSFQEVAMAKVKTGPKTKRKGGGIPAKAAKVDALAGQFAGAKALVVTEPHVQRGRSIS